MVAHRPPGADASQDTETRVWVRGREVIRGIVERRPLPPLLTLADQAEAILATPGVGTGGVLAGRAQILALLGRQAEARTTMHRVYDAADRLPARVTDDTTSMFGWSEHRLRHTESFVYTYLDEATLAEAAHDRAIALYPDTMARDAAQVRIHRAMRLVRAGDTEGGAAHAHTVVNTLPTDQRIEAVLELARNVYHQIPPRQRDRPQATDLHQTLALPSGPTH